MIRYSILLRPNYNMAVFETYIQMCPVELFSVLSAHGLNAENVAVEKLNKATTISFDVPKQLEVSVLKSIYQLSFFYVLYESTNENTLKLVHIPYEPDFKEDLSIRLKYNGKTNESITRMMINLALAESSHFDSPIINLLDPLCGRGTSLFEAMISGFNAYGVEQDDKHVSEIITYVTRYLKEARIKHTTKKAKNIALQKEIGQTFELQYAKNKADFKAGNLNELKVCLGDTGNIKGVFPNQSMHIVVADLPYGVQHQNKTSKEQKQGLAPLLEKGLAAWTPLLKPGGSVAISWNIYTDKRQRFVEIFEANGYKVNQSDAFKNLKHRVSQAITRDILVAVKE